MQHNLVVFRNGENAIQAPWKAQLGVELLGWKHPAVESGHAIGSFLWPPEVLPPLLDIIPEARLNLVIYHLRKDEATEVRKPAADIGGDGKKNHRPEPGSFYADTT